MSKSRDAFRTISEVSDTLDTPAHVLRFWESKFAQIKPVKRAGGRRYYRPADVDLLAGIKQLLHDDGMTIKGAQKLMREQGIKHVAAIGSTALSAVGTNTGQADIIGEPVDAVEAKSAVQDVKPAAERPPMPSPEPDVKIETGITNVVTRPPNAPNGTSGEPALTLDLSPPDPNPPLPTAVEPSTPAPAPVFPADPSDGDSKAPARMFHLLHRADRQKLGARAKTIAPLLDRMRVLRDRIDIR